MQWIGRETRGCGNGTTKREERERERPRRTLFACVERESGESRDRDHRADKLSEDYSAGWGHVVMNGRS